MAIGVSSGTEVDLLLVVISFIIILGYLSEVVFKKTKIPEVMILLIIGLVLSQSHLLPSTYINTLRSLTPLFGSIALITIMFDGGKIIKLDKSLPSGLGYLLAFLDTALPAIAMAVIMYLVFHWQFIYGAILGTMLGETSTIMIAPMIKRLNISSKIYDILLVEATFNSVFSILIFYLLFSSMSGATFTLVSYVQYTITYISVAVLIGILGGLGWLFVQNFSKGARGYVATIAIAFLLYAFVSFFNGAAVITVLIYALIIGNSKIFNDYFKFNKNTDEQTTDVEDQIEFLVRTFFFVLLGLIAYVSIYYLIFAAAITGILIILRKLEIGAAMRKIDQKYKDLAFSLMPRGLTAAVLSSIYLSSGAAYSQEIFYIVFMVILLTNVVFSIMASRASKRIEIAEKQKSQAQNSGSAALPSKPTMAAV